MPVCSDLQKTIYMSCSAFVKPLQITHTTHLPDDIVVISRSQIKYCVDKLKCTHGVLFFVHVTVTIQFVICYTIYLNVMALQCAPFHY